jgi:hypothetical protein
MDIRKHLHRTKRLLAVTAVALLGSHAALAADTAVTGDGKLQQKAYVDFAVTIPKVLQLVPISQLRTLEVGEAKVVEVAEANVFEVISTMRSYALQFEITDPEVVSVEIEGLGRPVRVVPGGTSVSFTPATNAERRIRRNLTYTVHYAPTAKPGPRRMPVSLSFNAV